MTIQKSTFIMSSRQNGSMITLVVFILLILAVKILAGPDYGPKYWSPTENVITPHIEWDKPDVQGALKVLFIVSRTGMREVTELAQRIDIDYTVFAVGAQYNRYPGGFLSDNKYEPDRACNSVALTEDLKAKLDVSYDIIAIGNVNWSSLPLVIRYRILRQVKGGVGLIGVISKADIWLKQATVKKKQINLPSMVPFKGLPAFARYKDVSAWLAATTEYSVFGRGKILMLKGFNVPRLQAFTPELEGNLLEFKSVEYDYYLAWLGHLMRFVAGRTRVCIRGDDYIVANRLELTNMEYFVSGLDGKTVTCEFTFRNDNNDVLVRRNKKVRFSANEMAVDFKVPRFPAGRYFADLWVKEDAKIWAYGSSFIELMGDSTIEAVELRGDYCWKDNVAGKIRVVAGPEVVDGLTLVLRQKDTYGRITAESCVEFSAVQTNAVQEMSFELTQSQPLTIVQYLDVELWRGKEVLDRVKKAFSISNLLPKNDIRMIGWFDGWLSYSAYSMCDELAKAGFDTQYGPQPNRFSEIPLLSNIRHIPYCPDRMFYPRTKIDRQDNHNRVPCLNDPKERKKLREQLSNVVLKEKPFSTVEYSMGDELGFVLYDNQVEKCFCHYCLAGFYHFLREEYGSLKKVNLEYDTNYASFKDIRPVTVGDVKNNSRLAPLWVDYRRYMERCWVEIFQYSTDIIRKTVPIAKIGYEGSDTLINSYRAADFYKLMQVIQVNGTYDGAFVPYAVMCFAQPETLLGLGWYGGYNSHRCPEVQRYKIWRHLFRGANSYWLFTTDACGSESVMAPDLSFYDFFNTSLAELQEIKRGIGKLLMTAKRDNDGIAILYSQSSVHVSTLTKKLPPMEMVLNALTPLFEDSGFQFWIISSEQVANRELKNGEYRLLWLPYAQSLSLREAEKIEAFVRKGGTVIADLRPGVCDEHGKPYKNGGILDKVFGVKQVTSRPVATNCDVEITLNEWSKTLKNVSCDWSLKPEIGKANALLGTGNAVVDFEKKGMIINQYGKGKAILLNFSLSDYAGVKGCLESSAVKISDGARGIRQLFKELMVYSEIEEPVKIEPDTAGVRLYRFVNDGIIYLGVLQELPEASMAYVVGEAKPLIVKPAVLKLGEKRHVYDVRQGKYTGYTDRIKTMIEPVKGMLFALMPYEVKGLKLDAPDRIGQGETLKYKVEIEGVKQFGLHVFRVELVSPKGEYISYYAENIVGENGKAVGLVPLALNEAVGEWKILVRDAATGIMVEHVFSVEERK